MKKIWKENQGFNLDFKIKIPLRHLSGHVKGPFGNTGVELKGVILSKCHTRWHSGWHPRVKVLQEGLALSCRERQQLKAG